LLAFTSTSCGVIIIRLFICLGCAERTFWIHYHVYSESYTDHDSSSMVSFHSTMLLLRLSILFSINRNLILRLAEGHRHNKQLWNLLQLGSNCSWYPYLPLPWFSSPPLAWRQSIHMPEAAIEQDSISYLHLHSIKYDGETRTTLHLQFVDFRLWYYQQL
jgi:hypothetical protein